MEMATAMETMRATEAVERASDAGYGWRDTLMERLGLSREEYRLLTDKTLTVRHLYGYDDDDANSSVPADLANVETFRLEDQEICAWALGRIDSMVFKPVDGSGGYGLVIGPAASEETLIALRAKVLADPRGWIAQEPIALSTAPTFVDGQLGARHLDLRPFAVSDGREVWVAPGGLTRVALPEGSLVVNSSQGGGSKDTWILAGADDGREAGVTPIAGPAAPRPATAPSLGPMPEQEAPNQQQQQQQQQPC